MITIKINNATLSCESGKTILDVCRNVHIKIPTLCYDKRLEPYGGCRLCLVEVKGYYKPLSSCTTPVEDGMEVITESEKLTALRKTNLALILSNHPFDCPHCEKTSDCRLQDIVYEYGADCRGLSGINTELNSSDLRGEKWNLPVREDNPFITYEPNKCILCGRCTRICNDVVMAGTIDITGKGFDSLPDTAFRKPRSLDNCEFCGQCVSACPTAALTNRCERGKGRPYQMQQVKTTCTYCGTGCNFYLTVKNNRVVKVISDYAAPVNRGNLCIKGRYGYEFIHHPDRLTSPLIRESSGFRAASWDEAFDLVATRFKELKAKYGPEALGGFSSSRCTNEENYLVSKVVRAVFGTNNVDNCARVCHAPTVAGLATSLGAGAASNSFNQIGDSDVLFIFGSNTTEGHPIVSLNVKKAIRRGARIIVADPRKIELVSKANVWLNLRPGSNIALLNGMIHIILKEGLHNGEFIEKRTEGFADLQEAVRKYTPENVEKITGVSPDRLTQAARIYAGAKAATIVYGLGVTEHLTGTENAMAIANLALVCGHIGRPSTGIMALRGQNNVQGASDMGPLPATFPGYQSVTNPRILDKFEKAWGAKLSSNPGLKSVEMLDEAKKGTFKGLYILGEDPAHTDPDLHHVREALRSLEFLVVQDIFPTETTQFAHVILPGASFAEKDGTFTNGERRVQRIRKAIEPLSGMAEWQALCEIATRMGYPMKYSNPSEIMDEIASLVSIYGGISYKRIEKEGIQWPCPTKEHPGTTTLYQETFSRANGRACFIALEHIGSGEVPSEQYPFVLITGRRREHYNNGSMTRHVSGIMELCPEELLEINPDDADRLGIKTGETVTVSSRRGSITVKTRLTDRSQKGNVFLSFHYQDTLTNIVTSEHRCRISGTPEYKSCAVRIDKL
ncbi:MAG: formate dehydrogenase subunit alpha [Nitrospirae bacterium]|nr:formate dehydrogenase subunit alpha [Nitrospirota bacterium]